MSSPNSRHRPRVRRKGFSFIEVMVVVVIMGLMAGAVTLSTRHLLDKAKQNRARADIATLSSALAAFYGERGRYPSNEEGLAVIVPDFITDVRLDPWGRAYQYNQPGHDRPYDLVSYGADGREGGEGADSDISNAGLQPATGVK